MDATLPRLYDGDQGPEDEMAVRLSHVPPRVRYGIEIWGRDVSVHWEHAGLANQ